MKVKEAIELLSKLPPEGVLVVASMGHGGSVPVLAFENAEPGVSDPWVDVIFGDEPTHGGEE